MKTTYTIAAIAMFAVIMGMSAIAPAMADKKGKIYVCHFSEAEFEDGVEIEPSYWKVIHINENGWNGHQNHNDGEGLSDEKGTEDAMIAACERNNSDDIPDEAILTQ